jgi:hypothetical protein
MTGFFFLLIFRPWMFALLHCWGRTDFGGGAGCGLGLVAVFNFFVCTYLFCLPYSLPRYLWGGQRDGQQSGMRSLCMTGWVHVRCLRASWASSAAQESRSVAGWHDRSIFRSAYTGEKG